MAPEPHPQPSSGDRGQAKQESRVVEPIEGEVVMSFLEAKRGLVGVRYTHSYHFGAIQVRNGKVAAFERFCLADADGVVRPAYARISREAELEVRVPMFRVDALPKAGQVFGSGKTSGRRQMVLLNEKLAALKSKEEEERTTILNELAASFSALQSAHRQALNEKKQVARPQAVSTVRHLSATAAPFSPPKISRAPTPQPAVPLVKPAEDKTWEEFVARHDGTANFRLGPSEAPEVALNSRALQVPGRYLKEIWGLPKPPKIPVSTGAALKKETMAQHVRYVERVLEVINEKEPLAVAIINAVEFLKHKHNWRNSTTLKAQASIQGALKVLPIYRAYAPVIKLAEVPEWSLSMRARQISCREEIPVQPQAAVEEQVMKAIASTSDDAAAAALLLGWLTASRLGCILQLHTEDVVVTEAKLAVTFRRGKGVRASGPYTVHTAPIPQQLLPRFLRHLESRDRVLFPRRLTGATLKEALRTVDTALEQRSIRRGALQAMARKGVSEELLMRFSGHKRVETLRRYLNWNAVNSKVQREMEAAAATLTCSTTTPAQAQLLPTPQPALRRREARVTLA